MATRQARGWPSTGWCRVTLAMLKHRWPGRSRVCGLSNARSLWHLERFSVRLPPPKSYQYLAKLTRARRSFKARPKTFETKRAPLPSAAPPCARLACTRRLTRATSPPRHHHAPRCCVLLWQGTRAGHGSAHVTAGPTCQRAVHSPT